MKIFMFSVDLKLDPEGRGYKVLEINDGLRSGFEGYKHATGKEMFRDVILRDYEKLFPGHETVSLIAPHGTQSGKPIISIPRTNSTINYYTRSMLVQQSALPFVSVNSDLRFVNFCTSKAYQSKVFASDPKLEALHPATRLISTLYFDAADEVKNWGSLPEKIILKADNDLGGNGIVILDGRKAKTELIRVLQNKNGKAPIWSGHAGYVGVVQDLLPPNLVEIDGEDYDATMRAVVTVWQEHDGADFKSIVHGAYWKPSAVPYSGLEDRKSRVSYSSAYREEVLPEKSWATKLKNRLSGDFSSAAFLKSFDSVKSMLPKTVEGQRVDRKTCVWLFPELNHAMPKLIRAALSKSVGIRAVEWLGSDSLPDRALGLSTCLQDQYYPETLWEKGKDTVLMEYPVHIAHALQIYVQRYHQSDLMEVAMLEKRLRHKQGFACDNMTDNVRIPVLQALQNARSEKFTSGMMRMFGL